MPAGTSGIAVETSALEANGAAQFPPAPIGLLCRRIANPNGVNRILIAEAIRDRRAGFVGVIPSFVVERRSQRAAAGHLEMAVGVRLPHPIARVVQPVAAIPLALLREPGDLVVAPRGQREVAVS